MERVMSQSALRMHTYGEIDQLFVAEQKKLI